MELIDTSVGFLTLTLLMIVYLMFARALPFGAVSLPCMTALTSIIYFYFMPAIALAGGNNEFFGMYLTSLEWTFYAVFLYNMGAMAAFLIRNKHLARNPAAPQVLERQFNFIILGVLWASVLGILASQVALGHLNLLRAEDYAYAEAPGEFKFINLFYTAMIPLTLVVLIRDNFSARSLLLLCGVLVVFFVVAFRYRIMILLFAVVVSFALIRGIKMRVSYVVIGFICALFIVNFIGQTRQYGRGIDISRVEDMSWSEILKSVGGEIGPIYVISHVASNPLPEPVLLEPWIIGLTRLVPSFLWPDKPTAEYLRHLTSGFLDSNAVQAGIAAPQQVEMLLQFGWIGLPILAFLYFYGAIYLIYRLSRLGREARIAGCAIAPAFFGFYMQTRGYFFQILSDGLFMFGPLFLVHLWERRPFKVPNVRGRPRHDLARGHTP